MARKMIPHARAESPMTAPRATASHRRLGSSWRMSWITTSRGGSPRPLSRRVREARGEPGRQIPRLRALLLCLQRLADTVLDLFENVVGYRHRQVVLSKLPVVALAVQDAAAASRPQVRRIELLIEPGDRAIRPDCDIAF